MSTNQSPVHPSSYCTVVRDCYGAYFDVVACVKLPMADGSFIEAVLCAYDNEGNPAYQLYHAPTMTELCWCPSGHHTPHEALDDVIHNIWPRTACQSKGMQDTVDFLQSYYYPALNPPGGFTLLDWKRRESKLFASGHYKKLPYLGIPFNPDHFIHRSTEKDEEDFIAFTPSDQYGLANRKTRMRLGRYLAKYHDTLPESKRASIVAKYLSILQRESAPITLNFTTSSDVINDIFETPMRASGSPALSCMYGKFTDWEHRPYHVYANSPDVAVAYLTRQDSIIARTVVDTKDKAWVRLYAHENEPSSTYQVLKDLLAADGYEEGNLEGCRLSKLPTRNGKQVLPYIDGDYSAVNPDGKYWVVVEDGKYTAENTNGHPSGYENTCPNCEGDADECDCQQCENCDSYECDCVRCENCDRFIDGNSRFNRCNCSRCDACNELTPDYASTCYRTCECDRCDHCDYIASECECVFCESCENLESECSCEPEEDEDENDSPTPPAPIQSTPIEIPDATIAPSTICGCTFCVDQRRRTLPPPSVDVNSSSPSVVAY